MSPQVQGSTGPRAHEPTGLHIQESMGPRIHKSTAPRIRVHDGPRGARVESTSPRIHGSTGPLSFLFRVAVFFLPAVLKLGPESGPHSLRASTKINRTKSKPSSFEGQKTAQKMRPHFLLKFVAGGGVKNCSRGLLGQPLKACMLLGQASASPRTTKSDFRKPNLHKSAPPRVHVSTGLRTHGPMGPELHGSMAPWAGLSSFGEVWLIPRSTAPRVHGPTGPPLVEPISRQVARSRDSFRNVLHIRNSGFAGVRWTTPTASRPSSKKYAVLM